MSIIQKLSEGIVNRDMKKEGQALLSKWEATGLLEGIDTQQGKHNMARLLENQAKELLRESNAMSNGQVEGFASVAFPIVRRVFAGLIANDLVSVQPMSLPSGLIFFLDFVYSPRIGSDSVTGAGSATDGRFGNSAGKSIYGTDQVGSQVTGGVDLVGATLKENLSGPRQLVGYAYAAPTGSNDEALTGATNWDDVPNSAAGAFAVSSATEANKKAIQHDPDLLSDTSLSIAQVDISEADIADAQGVDGIDFENLAAFVISEAGINLIVSGSDFLTAGTHIADGANTNIRLIRRLTKRVEASDTRRSAKSVRFTFATSVALAATTSDNAATTAITAGQVTFPRKDTIAISDNAALGAIDSFNFPFEGNGEMPEIDIKVDSIAITAQTKKLKAKWTPELGQDLNAYHNLDAEVELTSILSEQIALEIDRELLADLVNGATAATYYWSRSPGLFVNKVTGQELGASSAAPDFTGTVSEWYETLIETINDVSAQIHLKTLRGGANYIVCSPEVANILEFTSGYRANVTADADKGTIGAVKVGSLSRKFDIVVDPYFPRNAILVGRKGGSFLESGYVYAPYVPLQTTPTIFGVEDFVPRKGVMTRYGKKMVRPDMYGLVICRGLLGEEGATS